MVRAPSRLNRRQLNGPASGARANAVALANATVVLVTDAAVGANQRVVLRRLRVASRSPAAAVPFTTVTIQHAGGGAFIASASIAAGSPSHDSGPLYIPGTADLGIERVVANNGAVDCDVLVEWDIEEP